MGLEGLLLMSSLSSNPESMSRARGAGLTSGEYCGSGGTEVSRFVRTLTSILGCIMDVFILKGAIS